MQTTVDAQSGRWYEGQIPRPQNLDDKKALNEDATAMKVGQLVIAGTDPNTQAKKPVAAFTYGDILGVIYDAVGIREKALDTGEIDIETNRLFAYMREGYMAVEVASTAGLSIVKGTNAFFCHTAGDTPQHKWRNDLDTNKASKAPVIFMESVTVGAGGTAIVEVKVHMDSAIDVS